MIDTQEQFEQQFLEEALVSPKAALMHLTLDIDRELRKLLASTGALHRYLVLMSPTLPNALKIFDTVQGAVIPDELKKQINEFWSMRNTVVHMNSEVPMWAFELGLSILRVLRKVPRPSYIVKKVNIPLYSDQHCKNQRPDVHGVLIETLDAEGNSQGARIHPSTRDYVEGMSVGWEWANDRRQSWDETWYKNPETGKCTPLWSGAMEFIGRDVNQL